MVKRSDFFSLLFGEGVFVMLAVLRLKRNRFSGSYA